MLRYSQDRRWSYCLTGHGWIPRIASKAVHMRGTRHGSMSAQRSCGKTHQRLPISTQLAPQGTKG
eukprot:1058323-Amphidinium_carterae.1